MKKGIILISVFIFMVSCSTKEEKTMACTGQIIEENGKTIAYVGYAFEYRKGTSDPIGLIGPAVVLLGRDKSTMKEGAMISPSGSRTFSTILDGKEIPLTKSDCIIYNPMDKTYETIDLKNAKGNRIKFIKEKAKEANKENAEDGLQPPQI